MSQWYLSKNGQALGPLEEDKVIALIESGDVNPVDLIYKAGASEWLPISQVEDFAEHFQRKAEAEAAEPEPQGVSEEQRDWVLLKKVMTEKGKEYKQIGPFAHAEVMDLLDKGKVRFTDFAWKKGMESWAKIGQLDDFAEPLPSSPDIDMSLYEKSQVDIDIGAPDENTVTDVEAKASMTELVNIETYEHQKTAVMSQEDLKQELAAKQEASPSEEEDEDLAPTLIAEESHPDFEADSKKIEDLKTLVGPDEDQLTATIREDAPINQTGFVTSTDIRVSEEESDVSLWSLEPPSAKKKAEKAKAKKAKPKEKQEPKKEVKSKNEPNEDLDKTRVIDFEDKKEEKKQKNVKKASAARSKPKKKPKKQKKEEAFDHISLMDRISEVDTETWQWVGMIGVLSVAILFFYLSIQSDTPDVVYEDNSNYKTELEMAEAQVAAQQQDQYQPEQQSPVQQPAPAPEPMLKEPQISDPTVADVPTVVNQVPDSALDESSLDRELASQKETTKKQKLSNQAEKMSRSKRKKNTPKARPSSRRVSKPSGGRKAQSFYRQRDRKALFYSSLKAETLAVDIEKQYRKLRGNKAAWRKFYAQWRKKVQSSLAREIRDYPKRSELYAYPDFFKSFKKDYQLFYRYGEGFNAKVTGGRVPSAGVPDNMQKLFTKHKNRAKSLGI